MLLEKRHLTGFEAEQVSIHHQSGNLVKLCSCHGRAALWTDPNLPLLLGNGCTAHHSLSQSLQSWLRDPPQPEKLVLGFGPSGMADHIATHPSISLSAPVSALQSGSSRLSAQHQAEMSSEVPRSMWQCSPRLHDMPDVLPTANLLLPVDAPQDDLLPNSEFC